MPPIKFFMCILSKMFCTTGLVPSKWGAQMYGEEIHFGKLQFNNTRKQFWHIWLWWPWPLTLNSIGFLCYPGWTCGPSLRRIGQGILELLIWIGFGTFDQVTLTFDLVTPKSLGFLCYPGSISGQVGQGVLELLIGNEKVTDGPTNRHMCKAICPLFSEGGHKNILTKQSKFPACTVEIHPSLTSTTQVC